MRKYLTLLGLFGAITFGTVSFADGDTSTDSKGFQTMVDASSGVLIRVAIDKTGQENSTSAELRLSESPVQNSSQVVNAFESGVSAAQQAQISQKDISADSSTCGFYNYNFSYGWAPAYYYSSYTPTYYYGGYYYNYSTPSYYYTNWDLGYRYYYYPRYYY